MKTAYITITLSAVLTFAVINSKAGSFEPTVSPDKFYNYWFDGTGEISTYRLYQSRYGEVHEGTATFVFVTEKFLPEKQVKDETGRSNSVPILKLIYTKNFLTGVYPYSMMLSTFTELDGSGRLLKLTETSQDWCGHTFAQINWRETEYQYRRFSYFEAEGDTELTFPDVWLEDQLWTLARLNPSGLPTGQFNVWQGAFVTRLLHVPATVTRAAATLRETDKGLVYKVEFANTKRTLQFTIGKEFPHVILGWQETYQGVASNANAKNRTTTASLIKTTKVDYWNRNKKRDKSLNSSLYR